MKSSVSQRSVVLRSAVSAVLREIIAIRKETSDWRALRERALWRELVGCILGSGVRFQDALCAVTRLANSGALAPQAPGSSLRRFERRIARVLLAPCTRNDGCIARYRFPRRRAELIRMAACAIYSPGRSLKALLRDARHSRHARELLVRTVPGIGPKQASLFLRNVGFADDLAILDVHVLRYLRWIERRPLNERPNVSNLRTYEQYEKRIRRYALEASVTVGDLDLAVWITSRVASREGMK